MVKEIIDGLIKVIDYYFDRQEQMINSQTDRAMERIPEIMDMFSATLPKFIQDVEKVIKSESSEPTEE